MRTFIGCPVQGGKAWNYTQTNNKSGQNGFIYLWYKYVCVCACVHGYACVCKAMIIKNVCAKTIIIKRKEKYN